MNRALLIPRRAGAPTSACLRCHFEDCLGICNTVPAELDEVLQAAPPYEAASAVSGIGFENEQPPAPPRFAFLLAPAFERWPRATPAVLMVLLLALWGLTGDFDLQASLEGVR